MSDTPRPIRVLLVEDNPGDALLMQAALNDDYPRVYSIAHAGSLKDAMAQASGPEAFDAALLDLSLPDSHGPDTIHRLSRAMPRLPIIVLTGQVDEHVAMEAVRHGAQDYLIKGKADAQAIARAIRYAIDRKAASLALQEAHDDLERKVQERTAELRQANRIMQMVSECNLALVRIEDEHEMMQEICQIILDVGGYLMAWVGMAEHDEGKTVRPVSYVGFEEGYLEKANITWADNERGRGPTGTAIRLGGPQIGRDFLTDPELAPWREQALKRGYRSSIALPLKTAAGVFGALMVYSAQPDAFGESQVRTMTELADDMAFGIVALRTRTALRDSRQQLQQVLHSAPVLIWAADTAGRCTLADGNLESLGLTGEQVVGRGMNEVIGDRPDIDRHFSRARAGELVVAEIEYCGMTFESRYSPLRDDKGAITGVMSVWTDITERRRAEHEVLKAAEREQRRIGRDLHDSIQGSLAGIGLMLEGLKRDVDDPGRGKSLAADVDNLIGIVRQTLEQTRGLARGLCPAGLTSDGLMTAMQQLAATTKGLFRVDCRFDCKSPVLIDDEMTASQLYYIGQEAVSNALKHAKARQITIRLDCDGEGLMLGVQDDGVGIPDVAGMIKGMGLRTMSYRARMIGADLRVARGRDGGTYVHCSLPMPGERLA